MSTNNNKKNGNHFEEEFCELLALHGFWAHNMAQNQVGQPADVIAVKNGIPVLIDCKECETNRFPLSRIEGNQEGAIIVKFWCFPNSFHAITSFSILVYTLHLCGLVTAYGCIINQCPGLLPGLVASL